MERAGFRVDQQVSALGTVPGLLRFAEESQAVGLILVKHVYEAEWAGQGWTASEGGLLEEEFPEDP